MVAVPGGGLAGRSQDDQLAGAHPRAPRRPWQSGPVKRPVLVRPRSSRPGVGGTHDGMLVVAVREPATDGRANRATVAALAAALGVARGDVRIAAGTASRRKLVEVHGDEVALARAWDRLAAG